MDNQSSVKNSISVSMSILTIIIPRDITERQLKWLQEGFKTYPHPESLQDYIARILTGQVQLWTWGTGLIATYVSHMAQKKYLHVDLVCGSDYIKNIEQIEADLTVIAKRSECTGFSSLATKAGMVAVHEKIGCKVLGTLMTKEFD